MPQLPKIVVILGPTASGKTDLGIQLCQKFNGEVISVDSRQIYQKMNIGTVQPEGKWERVDGRRVFVSKGVPHYMIDIVDPGKELSLAEFKEQAIHHLNDILGRGQVPFLVGGTGLYIWAIVDNLLMPRIAPDKQLRRRLEKKSLPKLQKLLRRIDPTSAASIDINNPRRVIRALEVKIWSGESFMTLRKTGPPLYDALQIGIQLPLPALYERINMRAARLIEAGLVPETEALLEQKYGWNLPSMSGLGYKQMGQYLRGERSLEQALEDMQRATRQYARRQMTWFKRDKRIQWVEAAGMNKDAEKLVEDFLNH